MIQNLKFGPAAFSLVVLASCGVGGAGFEKVAEDALALQTEVEAMPYIAPADMVVSGTATYNGYVGIDTFLGYFTPYVIGQLTVNVDFDEFDTAAADNAVTGSIHSMVDGDDERVGGTIDISGDGTVFGFYADMTGTVISGLNTFTVDDAMFGYFQGVNGEGLEVDADGNVWQGGAVIGTFDMIGYAKR